MMKCFHAVRLCKLISIYSFLQLAILQVKTSLTFTSEQRQLGSDYARACGMNMAKKKKYANHVRRRRFIFDSACAGLSLSPLLS